MANIYSDSSREKIRSRMLKNAAQLWGHQTSEVASYDPLVGLLFGACATEIEKIYNDLYGSQARVLERLSKLLTPEVLKGARPAHAVMHARSVEPSAYLKKELQVYYQKKIQSRDSSARDEYKDLFFCPAVSAKVFDGDVALTASGNRVSKVTNTLAKDKFMETKSSNRFGDSVLWLGLDLSKKIHDLDGVSFYFDWMNDPDRNNYFHILPFAKWYLDGQELMTETGLTVNPNNTNSALEVELEQDVAKITERNASLYYQQRFVSLHDALLKDFELEKHLCNYPKEFEEVFSPQELQNLNQKVVWLKIVFPPSLPVEAVQEAFCAMNCVPVMNLKLSEFSYRLQNNLNIIPLSTEEDLFFSIRQIKSEEGYEYILNPLKDSQQSATGSYILRQGGVERFDERNASDLLAYLLDLLRDESASFSVYGHEMISANLRDLSQNMAVLEQKVTRNDSGKELVTYIIMKPKNHSETIFVEYWSTNGEAANEVRVGAKLNLYSGYDVAQNSLVLVSNAAGGRDSLNESEMLNAFRQALVSRGRIVSQNDIKQVCFQELGANIRSVEIKKGVMIGTAANDGFKRTVDVYLTPTSSQKPTAEEWGNLCHNLQVVLESQSSGFFPIRVMVKGQS